MLPSDGFPFSSVSMSVGVYVMFYLATSLLATNTLVWVEGPPLPLALQCAVRISQDRFLVVGGEDRRMLREYNTKNNAGPTKFKGWLPPSTWPSLERGRSFPACQVFGDKVVIAGGWEAPTVETIHLITKAVVRGADMLQPRYHFQLAPFGEEGHMRLLALGGEQSSRVEWWDEESSFWQEAAVKLSAERCQAGAVTVTPEMVCTPSCRPDNCIVKGGSVLLHTDSSHGYWKVPVDEGVTMMSGAITATCRKHGMDAVCPGRPGCIYSDESMCMAVPLESGCTRMSGLSAAICNGETNARKCPQLEGVFQYHRHRNSVDIGIVGGRWVSGRDHTSGANGRIIYAFCAGMKDFPVPASLIISGSSLKDNSSTSGDPVEVFPDDMTSACNIPDLPEQGGVVCGDNIASSCAECVWCNKDCQWIDKVCIDSGSRGGRWGHSLSLIPGNPPFLVACGLYIGSTIKSCIMWHKGLDSWTHYAFMRESRYDHASVVLQGGIILLIGGSTSQGTAEIIPYASGSGSDSGSGSGSVSGSFSGSVCGSVSGSASGSVSGSVSGIGSGTELRGGDSENEGNVFVNGKPVCDDEWDFKDAKVLCRSLGFSVGVATKFSKFGSVPPDFSMDNVRCEGDESSLDKCPHRTEDEEDCGASEGAGVICGHIGDFGVDIELQNSGYLSCALAIEEGREFVVIGGYRHKHTDRYAKNGTYLPYPTLPDLREPRWYHGCSVFTNVTGTFYLVAGGHGHHGRMGSTEIHAVGSSSWLTVSPLPRALSFSGAHFSQTCSVAAGAGPVLCTGGLQSGGNNDREEVWRYTPGLDRWDKVGTLRTDMEVQAVTQGNLDLCQGPEWSP